MPIYITCSRILLYAVDSRPVITNLREKNNGIGDETMTQTCSHFGVSTSHRVRKSRQRNRIKSVLFMNIAIGRPDNKVYNDDMHTDGYTICTIYTRLRAYGYLHHNNTISYVGITHRIIIIPDVCTYIILYYTYSRVQRLRWRRRWGARVVRKKNIIIIMYILYRMLLETHKSTASSSDGGCDGVGDSVYYCGARGVHCGEREWPGRQAAGKWPVLVYTVG